MIIFNFFVKTGFFFQRKVTVEIYVIRIGHPAVIVRVFHVGTSKHGRAPALDRVTDILFAADEDGENDEKNDTIKSV